MSPGLLRADGFRLASVDEARLAVLVLSAFWSLLLIWKVAGRYRTGNLRTAVATLGSVTIGGGVSPWLLMFSLW